LLRLNLKINHSSSENATFKFLHVPGRVGHRCDEENSGTFLAPGHLRKQGKKSLRELEEPGPLLQIKVQT
jgi:hypothetical protein